MQLGYHHAFGAVHNEGAVFGHDGKFANQDVVLDFFLQLAVFAIFFENAEGQRCVELHTVGEPTFATFRDAVFRDAEIVFFVFQGIETVLVCNREDVLEDPLQTDFHPLFLRNVGLKELLVRRLLDFDQIGKFQLESVGGITLSLRCH